MSNPKRKFMDALAGLSDAPDDSESEDCVSDASGSPAPAKRPKGTKIDVAALQQHGYKGGPSVLYVPEAEEPPGDWNWSSGMERRADGLGDEDFHQRQRNRDVVTTKAEESAVLAKMAAEQQLILKRGRREEDSQHKRDLKQQTWSKKERQKRDRGQQSRGKSAVEEEKRKGRAFGIYSGFD